MSRRVPLLRLALLLSTAIAAVPLTAHVGTLTTVYEGTAGPYPIRVIVRPPGVVPGLAEVTVRTQTPGVTRVRVKAVKSDAGEAATPWSDEALPVKGDANLHAATMWLMGSGSYRVYVDVDGSSGPGRGVVPIVSVATKRLPMSPAVSWLLLVCCGLLMAGIASIAGAWRREATLPPGAVVDDRRRRRARVAMVVAFVAATLFVVVGRLWWNAVDNAYRKVLFQPPRVTTSVAQGMLELQIDDPSLPPLLPDHGKLMHLFLIQEGARPAFAHLHPWSRVRDSFRAALPPLPAGLYRRFADITHESGFSQTLVDRVQLPAPTSPQPPTDGDDSWQFPPSPSLFTSVTRQPIRANDDIDLRFMVDGAIEPYMGMMGHAAVVADDGSVFVHLHPMGTISMASSGHSMTAMSSESGTNAISFPFTFPKPGHYRIWVQTKVGGQVVTGAFEQTVR